MDHNDRSAAYDFPILGKLNFFNHAGVAPISGSAAAAMRRYIEQAESAAYVGSGWYRRAKDVKEATARLLNARGAHEIAFVGNTSMGLAMVARGYPWREGDNVVITNVEYPANRYPWEDLKRLGVQVIEVEQDADGRIDAEEVAEAINDRTRIVAISHVQYASGYRIDLRPISDMVHRARGYLCVDAIQSVGAMPVDVQAMGIDFLAADGHKWLLAPEGCGLFYCREDLIEMMHPAIVGWMNMVDASDYGNYKFEFEMDARRFEPGSYNIPGILGLGASIDMFLDIGMDVVWGKIEALTARLVEGLEGKGYRIFSPRGEGERSGIVIFDPPPPPPPPVPAPEGREVPDAKRIVGSLEQQGIVIVVREGRLRASPHFYNTVEQIDGLVAALP